MPTFPISKATIWRQNSSPGLFVAQQSHFGHISFMTGRIYWDLLVVLWIDAVHHPIVIWTMWWILSSVGFRSDVTVLIPVSVQVLLITDFDLLSTTSTSTYSSYGSVRCQTWFLLPTPYRGPSILLHPTWNRGLTGRSTCACVHVCIKESIRLGQGHPQHIVAAVDGAENTCLENLQPPLVWIGCRFWTDILPSQQHARARQGVQPATQMQRLPSPFRGSLTEPD